MDVWVRRSDGRALCVSLSTGDTLATLGRKVSAATGISAASLMLGASCGDGVVWRHAQASGGEAPACAALADAVELLAECRRDVLHSVRTGSLPLAACEAWARNDAEVVRAALLATGGQTVRHAADGMRDDVGVMSLAVSLDGIALRYGSDAIRGDAEVVLAAVHNAWHAYLYADVVRQADPTVAHAAVSQNGVLLRHLPDSLRASKALSIASVAQSPLAFEYVDASLQNDPDVLAAARRHGSIEAGESPGLSSQFSTDSGIGYEDASPARVWALTPESFSLSENASQ